MKILHICLSSHYTEELLYQDNIIPDCNAKSGHQVVIVSDVFFYKNGIIVEGNEQDTILKNGVRLIRMKYDVIINSFISSKIRKVKKLKLLIEEFSPDSILFHGVAGWEMLTTANYKKKNPNTLLYIDSHEDFNNSALNIVSYVSQYLIFNRVIVQKIKKYVNKFLYVTYESKNFLKKMYRLEECRLEFYPLGGKVYTDLVYKSLRNAGQKLCEVNSDHIVFTQTGKFDDNKKLLETLNAFTLSYNKKFRLIIAGSFDSEILKSQCLKIIDNDNRIKFLGWQGADNIEKLLCGTDIYLQPGSQSATLQASICARCAIIAKNYPSHHFLCHKNGWLIDDNLVEIIDFIDKNPACLKKMSYESKLIAERYLNYHKLASRITVP